MRAAYAQCRYVYSSIRLMRLSLILILILLPCQTFAQIENLVEQSEEPCKSSLSQLYELWKQTNPNFTTAKKAFSLTTEYHKYDLKHYCGTVNGLESKFLSDIIIQSKDSAAVDLYFEHLNLYEGSASEPLNDHFERILLHFPTATVLLAEKLKIKKQEELASRLAFGFLNNT